MTKDLFDIFNGLYIRNLTINSSHNYEFIYLYLPLMVKALRIRPFKLIINDKLSFFFFFMNSYEHSVWYLKNSFLK